MESGDFHYTDDQWAKIAGIVERAGGSKEKLNEHRLYLEQKVGWRLSRELRVSVNRPARPSRAVQYERVAEASSKLKTALSGFGWISFADAEETWTNFISALDRIHETLASTIWHEMIFLTRDVIVL